MIQTGYNHAAENIGLAWVAVAGETLPFPLLQTHHSVDSLH